jgi:hypothetical protein
VIFFPFHETTLRSSLAASNSLTMCAANFVFNEPELWVSGMLYVWLIGFLAPFRSSRSS